MVFCNNRVHRLTLVPQNGESFYASIAHHLFGPFRSEMELNATAISLHTSAVRFIQRNKDKFQKDIVDLYDKVSPRHSFDSDVAFEHCCFYLMSPSHMGIHLTALAIATLYCRTIIVMDENGQDPIEFKHLYAASEDSIMIIERKNLHNHFDAVDSCEEETVGKPVTPDQNLDFELLVATWQVRDCSTSEMQNKIDNILMTYNIDLACVQTTFPSKSRLSTAHYNWWCVIDNTTNDKGKSRGIGFLLRNDHKGILSDFIFYSEDLASTVLIIKGHKFNIIGCHLPEQTYKQYPQVTADILAAFKLSLQSSHQLILLGQFNARIGPTEDEQNGEHKNIGPQLIHKKFNESGKLLKKLAVCHNLRITSTYHCENSPTSATYKYPKTDKMLQISHILLQNRDLQTTTNFRWWESLSNHAIVGCKISSYLAHIPAC
uniref:Endonuclease/exonuclease/phosphatase domain-containing protein n=2 Tax=Graphocephala atropunctata TaxID=36148 RepID=A0A1B6KSJ2_9HEMI